MEKINIAQLLKGCPKGMELDCVMYEDVYFDYVDELNIIHCYIQHETHKTSVTFNQHGAYSSVIKSKCVIFPKGKTTWEGFQGPFKDGDVVATIDGLWIGITTGGTIYESMPTYCVIGSIIKFEAYLGEKVKWSFDRLATEEEKQKLFDAIKENGYKWNPETKTLEKLIVLNFKIGDKIRAKGTNSYTKILGIKWDQTETYYETPLCEISVKDQDKFELVPNKFDITTLKPFDRVLVRDNDRQYWTVNIFGYYMYGFPYPFCCSGNCYGTGFKQCIPYKGNESLLGKADDCADYYKTWE